MRTLFYVTPCKFNKSNYPDLIGKLSDVPFSYAKVICVSNLEQLTRYFAKFHKRVSFEELGQLKQQFDKFGA